MDENAKQEDYRARVTNMSKVYKTTWVELGGYLNHVASEKLYLEWGYSNFEEYCKVELKIKKNTAIKLTNAYFFVTQDQPDLREKELDLDTVSALSKVKKDENCDSEFFSDMMDLATKGKSAATIAKKHKEYSDEGLNKTQEFFKKSSDLAKRLLSRIQPVSNIQPRYKDTLSEMVSSFDAESQGKED